MRLCGAVLPSSLSPTLSVSLVDRRGMECYPTVLVVLIVISSPDTTLGKFGVDGQYLGVRPIDDIIC